MILCLEVLKGILNQNLQSQAGKSREQKEMCLATRDLSSGEVQDDWWTYPFCYKSHRLHAGPIQVVIVLAGFYELVLLDIFLHLFSGNDKVIVSAIDLVVTLWPCSIFTKKKIKLN